MAVGNFVARAHAERPASWLPDDVFVAHVRGFAATDAALAALHAGDLYVACACAHGVREAIDAVEREHFSRIREFAASVDATPQFVAELTQRLRARLLVADADRPARIATYSGRGSLGGWIRVATVRLARDIARAERAAAKPRDDLEPEEVDPELGYLKQVYGDAVNRAIGEALNSLDDESRAIIKMHYVDGLSIDQVGVAFGKSRATAARMLAAARLVLLRGIRERVAGIVGVREDEADSLLEFVRSRLDVSLSRLRAKAIAAGPQAPSNPAPRTTAPRARAGRRR